MDYCKKERKKKHIFHLYQCKRIAATYRNDVHLICKHMTYVHLTAPIKNDAWDTHV